MKYCALLLSSRTDPVHAKERTKALEELKINYKDKEWNAFYQTLVALSSVFVHNTHLGIYQDVLTAPFVQIKAEFLSCQYRESNWLSYRSYPITAPGRRILFLG